MDVLLNGESAKQQGLQLAERPPIPAARMRYETIEVPGRNGTLTVEDGYDPVEIPVSFNFIEYGNAKPKTRQIKNWLTGKDRLVFSDDPEFYWIIQQEDISEIENDLKEYGAFTVTYTCEPFEYQDAGTKTLQGHGKVTNPSAIAVQPVITVYGQGEIRLTVNGKDVTLKNVVDWIRIDGIHEVATKNGVNLSDEMIGEFPVLEPGENTISFTTNATEVQIEQRWAWR